MPLDLSERKLVKKASHNDLAEYLGVTVSAIKQYNKKKRLLMLVGLKKLMSLEKE